jgi:DNA-binding transcriptional LysR family regulator
MEIRQLQYFILVAEEKSFSAAAKRAFLSQQAISKSIKNLESELGVHLFDRMDMQLGLTPYGRALLDRAIRLVAMADDTIKEIGFMKKDLKKDIWLGIPGKIFQEINSDQILSFQDLHPEWELQILESVDKAIEQKVFREKLDIGIIGAMGDMRYFDFYSIIKNGTRVAMHKDNPLAERGSIYMKDLKNEIIIGGDNGFNAVTNLYEAFRDIDIVPRVRYEVSTIMAKALLLLNRGIYFYPARLTIFEAEPNIASVSIIDDPHVYNPYIITKKGRRLSAQAETFKKHLIKITGAVKIE